MLRGLLFCEIALGSLRTFKRCTDTAYHTVTSHIVSELFQKGPCGVIVGLNDSYIWWSYMNALMCMDLLTSLGHCTVNCVVTCVHSMCTIA